jgi:hypothetical protein
MTTYTAADIDHATAEAARLYHAVQVAGWDVQSTDCTLAGEWAAIARLRAAVDAYAAWLAQDTRPATAPSWTIVGHDIDGHIVAPLDDWTPEIQTVY